VTRERRTTRRGDGARLTPRRSVGVSATTGREAGGVLLIRPDLLTVLLVGQATTVAGVLPFRRSALEQ
jgi:hypothetical protein